MHDVSTGDIMLAIVTGDTMTLIPSLAKEMKGNGNDVLMEN